MNSPDSIRPTISKNVVKRQKRTEKKMEDYSGVDEEPCCARFEGHRLRHQSACIDVTLVIVPVDICQDVARDLIEWRRHAQNCLSELL